MTVRQSNNQTILYVSNFDEIWNSTELMKMIYQILDIFFVVFHSSLVLFNLFGWLWRKTRVINLVTLSLTGASWLFLGMIYGSPGYCPLTDWHFNILIKLTY